jgi:protein-L-isoaspartate(D-aspartate) O-methyltransferase
MPIGYGETISAPHMHATCLELLRDYAKPGARVLDVGSGSGYLTAVFGRMVGRGGGKVVGIEKHPELATQSLSNVRNAAPELLDEGIVEVKAPLSAAALVAQLRG